MKPIRILQRVAKMDAAGIEALIVNLYRNIDRNKVQFDFLIHREDEVFHNREIRELGGEKVLPINPFHHNEYLKSLENFFKTHKDY